jgi:NADPH:quinone reductase-like Zn-dependent oxidoreductase
MKAAYVDALESKAFLIGELAAPVPHADEVLIQVQSAAITPTELNWFPTFHKRSGEPRDLPIVLGHEFSGLVEAIGPNVSGFEIGDFVYGMNDWFSNGAQAELCVAPISALAPKPQTLGHSESSVVPISALTAWQGLFERLKLQNGERILIHGASGAVGIFATQLAHRSGAHVIGSASVENAAFVRCLGADQVIDYRANRFSESIGKVDAVFDTVGGQTLARSWDALGDHGRLVTVATVSERNVDQRTKDSFMLVRADGNQLRDITKIINAGEMRVFVAESFPLKNAQAGYDRALAGKLKGKIVLQVGQ